MTCTCDLINETLILELGQLRHRVETIGLVWSLTVSLTTDNVRICSMLRTYSGLGFARRRERISKIPNVRPLWKFPWSYKNTFFVHARSKFEALLGQYCTYSGLFAGL